MLKCPETRDTASLFHLQCNSGSSQKPIEPYFETFFVEIQRGKINFVSNVLQFENFPTRTFEWNERILNFLDDLSQVINQNELSQIKMNLGFCKVI